MKKAWCVAGGAGLLVCLVGCEMAALFAGKGAQEALYKFDKNQRVLVVVDVRDGVSSPPNFDTMLAEGAGHEPDVADAGMGGAADVAGDAGGEEGLVNAAAGTD